MKTIERFILLYTLTLPPLTLVGGAQMVLTGKSPSIESATEEQMVVEDLDTLQQVLTH